MMETSFSEVYKIDVNNMTEKKNGLTYLSWANAWKEFKSIYPDADYEVKKDDNGKCWFGDDEHGYVVYTTVTVEGITYEMWLPVMDYRNKSILKPTTFDINKAVMRCLTKNLAMFGLGLYIYAGEDLPSEETSQEEPKRQNNTQQKQKPDVSMITPEQGQSIKDWLPKAGMSEGQLLTAYKITSLSQLPATEYPKIIKRLEEKAILNG